MDKPLVTVLSASGACSAPTGSQRLVDVGFEPTEVKRRVERRCRDNERNSQSVFWLVDKYLTALYNKRNDKEQQESYSANGCRCRTGKCAAVESAGGCVLLRISLLLDLFHSLYLVIHVIRRIGAYS